jgi:malic enzyme
MIAVVSDGTRVLGLGDIGPEAGLPAMEGKHCSSNIWGAAQRARTVGNISGRRDEYA